MACSFMCRKTRFIPRGSRFCLSAVFVLPGYIDAIFQLKFRRREVCLFFVAADFVSVLARQRVAQASQAEFCCGQEFKWHPRLRFGYV
jgi:hypothetical protein